MSQKNYSYIERKQDGLSIILQFPAKTEQEEPIKAEIKAILCNILNEYQKREGTCI